MILKKVISNILFLIGIIALWQIVYLANIFPKLIFPSVGEIGVAIIKGFEQENLLLTIGYSLGLILKGLVVGVGLAIILSAIAVISNTFHSVYNMIVSICDPLPGIALLPLAILWFGIGESTIIFIIVHSVIWPMSRNIMDGFRATPKIYTEVGKNIGLSRVGLLTGVYLPASLPYIISGLKVGWARAWRGLISAEMIFGVSGSIGGIGWYIYKKRYQLETPGVFGALVIIILIGILIEYGIFSVIEKKTIKKWGMVR